MQKEWKKYVVTLAITVVIFITAIGISVWIDDARVNNIRSLQDNISLNIISSETQSSLIKKADCSDIFGSDLSTQLSDMGDRLSFMESVGRGTDADVIKLKQYYYILEIKDYMLINSATKCPLRPTMVLYFYEPNCADCDKQGDVLTYLRQHYPDNIRVYSFDFSLNVPAVTTLANINKVEKPMPSIVVGGKAYDGFRSVDDIIAINPKIISDRTRIVLSPHFDDAALSLGGLIAKSTHSASSPIIVTAFTGTPKTATTTVWDSKSGFKDSTEAMTRRANENSNAANTLNSQIVNLDYLDNQYRPSIATSTLESNIAADIIKLIKNYDTSTSSMEIYGPAIFSAKVNHYDHAILHDAYMDVIAEYKPRGIVIFFIYEDFPYAEEAGAPKVDIAKALRSNTPNFSYAPIYIPLSDYAVSVKKDAIQAYTSQIKAMAANGLDIVPYTTDWTKNRCKGLFRVPSACELVYQVQK